MGNVLMIPDIAELQECLKLEFKWVLEDTCTPVIEGGSTAGIAWRKARKACAEKSQLKFVKDLRDLSPMFIQRVLATLGLDKDLIWDNYGKMKGCTIKEENKNKQDVYWCLVIKLKKHIGYTELDVVFDELTKKDMMSMG